MRSRCHTRSGSTSEADGHHHRLQATDSSFSRRDRRQRPVGVRGGRRTARYRTFRLVVSVLVTFGSDRTMPLSRRKDASAVLRNRGTRHRFQCEDLTVPDCTKAYYPDQASARLALNSIFEKAQRKARSGILPVRVYPCDRCDGWHLTAKPTTGKALPAATPQLTSFGVVPLWIAPK